MNNLELYKQHEFISNIENVKYALCEYTQFHIDYIDNIDLDIETLDLSTIVKYLEILRQHGLGGKFNNKYGYKKTKEFFKKECGLREEDIYCSGTIWDLVCTNLNYLDSLTNLNKEVYDESIKPSLDKLYYAYVEPLYKRVQKIANNYKKYKLKEVGNKKIGPYGDFRAETLHAIKNRTVDECCIIFNQITVFPAKSHIYKEKSKQGELNWLKMLKKFNIPDFSYSIMDSYDIIPAFEGWITFKNSDTYLKREKQADYYERWVEVSNKPKLK